MQKSGTGLNTHQLALMEASFTLISSWQRWESTICLKAPIDKKSQQVTLLFIQSQRVNISDWSETAGHEWGNIASEVLYSL